ncbi:SapC family protein [Aquabacter cavernae]|uniref:SapC family protein n=1 Tax=Aquabacter cavernae TaxID=2496029 RepID=UPI00237CDD1E|nr:SapC family protein [Aquabacter cavernae]
MPLFYSSVVPLDSTAHRAHVIAPSQAPFAFASGSHLIPAVVDEFAAASREIPIVFAPVGNRFASVFLCGLKPGSNLFVDADGRWNGTYLPAYLRRYPFMLGERDGAEPVVCVDPSYEGFRAGAEGAYLFDGEGKASPTLSAMIRLITDFALSARRTEDLCGTLKDLGLLKSVTIDVQGPTGPSASIHGLSIVDEKKLAELPDDAFLSLRRNGFLGPLHAHLFSIGATQSLSQKLRALDAVAAQAAA